MKEIILPYVLKNAVDFKGSVNEKAILGLVLRAHPELKKNIRKVLSEINSAVKEIEGKDMKEIETKLKKLSPDLMKEKKKEENIGPLKLLPNAEKGKVIVRIAPSPSGPLHIGHAYGTSLNYEYSKMYEGKFIARIEDTNPENIYENAYEMILEDANWLTENNVSEVVIQSSRLGTYYDYAETLVGKGKAYVCLCNPDKFREMKNKGEACPCRDLEIKENQQRYAKMFGEYAEGEAVLRLKTDIQDKNPAMRDFALMRINEHIHPKTGKEQRVWPLMVFSVAIDDHELGVTHVLNGKEHADNAAKEKIIMEYLGWKFPEYKHWGKINFEGFKLKTSTTKIAIEQGEYKGWDDIRLPFLLALKRRGYQAGAFRKYALEIGLSLNDKKVSLEEFWKNVNSFNRELVESKSNRYFFVDEPVKIKIIGAPKKIVEIDLHPDFPERGKRSFNASGDVSISENDFENLQEGKIHRLMDYCNFEVVEGRYKFISEKYEEYKQASNKGLIIHWLPEENNLVVEVLQENGEVSLGLGEVAMKNLQENDLVQLERNYYARVDKVEKNKIQFWYLHK